MKQITAIQELIDIVEMDYLNGVEISMKVFHGMLLNAKKKEKQQIIDAHIAGQKFHCNNDNPDSEEYYNQKYKP